MLRAGADVDASRRLDQHQDRRAALEPACERGPSAGCRPTGWRSAATGSLRSGCASASCQRPIGARPRAREIRSRSGEPSPRGSCEVLRHRTHGRKRLALSVGGSRPTPRLDRPPARAKSATAAVDLHRPGVELRSPKTASATSAEPAAELAVQRHDLAGPDLRGRRPRRPSRWTHRAARDHGLAATQSRGRPARRSPTLAPDHRTDERRAVEAASTSPPAATLPSRRTTTRSATSCTSSRRCVM